MDIFCSFYTFAASTSRVSVVTTTDTSWNPWRLFPGVRRHPSFSQHGISPFEFELLPILYG